MIRGCFKFWVGGFLVLTVCLACVGTPGPAGSSASETPPTDCHGVAVCTDQPDPNEPLSLESVLAHTQAATTHIESLACQLVYEFLQPFHESQTIRKGDVYYRRLPAHSELRIHFATKKEDDTPEVRYREDLFFDGVWRTHIDYQGRTVQKHQLAPEDEPIDALDLVSQNVPIFGFTGMESLQETYAIELLPSGADLADDHVHLRMIPDANAVPDHEYRSVHVWLDQETWLPVKVEAESLDEDIYRLHFVALKLNQPIDTAAFEVRIPDGFGTPEVVPLN